MTEKLDYVLKVLDKYAEHADYYKVFNRRFAEWHTPDMLISHLKSIVEFRMEIFIGNRKIDVRRKRRLLLLDILSQKQEIYEKEKNRIEQGLRRIKKDKIHYELNDPESEDSKRYKTLMETVKKLKQKIIIYNHLMGMLEHDFYETYYESLKKRT